MAKRLTKLLISAAFYACCRLRAGMDFLLGKRRPAILTVLYYHSVPLKRRRRFAEQMDELLTAAIPVDLDLAFPPDNGQRYVAVTFDDAFESVFRNALPELRTRGIPCAIFVPTACLGKRPEWPQNVSHEIPDESIVTGAELCRSVNSLTTFGSHTGAHADLSRLDETAARDELTRSKTDLESLTGREVRFLSFPYGAYNEETLRVAREAGYGRVFSALPCSFAPSERQFLVGRIHASTEDWKLEFRLKVAGGYQWMCQAHALKRALRRVARRLAPEPRRRLAERSVR